MTDWHIAQINVARMRFPLEDDRMEGFESRLDEINALAEASPGYVWRYQDESGSATDTRPLGEEWLINISVWDSIETLSQFAYRSNHRELLAGRRDWFHKDDRPGLALWWVEAGTVPTVDECVERLEYLREHGPSERAFTFGKVFEPAVRATGS